MKKFNESENLKTKYYDENNGLWYELKENYYYPMITIPKQNKYILGKYGYLRLDYLKEHKKFEYETMLLDGTLREHIVNTDIQAKKKYEILMKQMLEKNPIDEKLKDTDTLKWIGLMNNYKNSIEEILFKELICI